MATRDVQDALPKRRTLKKPSVHRPRDLAKDQQKLPVWFDGEGRRLPDRFATSGIFSPFGGPNYGLAQLNHYAVQSMAAFVLKAARGRVNVTEPKGLIGLDYWVERNFNQIEDKSILEFKPAQKLRSELMANPTLRSVHDEAVSWRHARFEELIHKDDTRELMGRLLHTPPSRLLPSKEAKFLMKHAIAELRVRTRD